MNALLISLPFTFGVLAAQTLSYDAAAIHKSPPGSEHRPGPGMEPGPQGGLRTHDTPVLMLIAWAWNVQSYQIIGAPGWASTQDYDITFTPDKSEAPSPVSSASKSNLSETSIYRDLIRLQSVLRDRFGLVLRSETREMPVYNLIQAKGGSKLTPHTESRGSNSNLRERGGRITGTGTTVERLAGLLSELLERPVHDRTNLHGQFDFTVVAGSEEPLNASLFAALPEQLGLKLESAKAPVRVYVIEHLNQPTEN
jgi:uncharacterized protein (TIGR03435 family)